jgi:hypothetical protein
MRAISEIIHKTIKPCHKQVRNPVSTISISVYRFTWVDRFQYFHSLVYLPSRTLFQDAGAQIVAANATSIVVMTGVGFSAR